jgi:hypothetical protein
MRTDVISVIAGGHSFGLVNRAKIPGMIITANEAGVMLPRVDHAVSMDRKWAEGRIEALRARKNRTWLRRSAVQNIDWTADGDWLRIFDCDHTTVKFSEDPQCLNGTNSGTCALNLAYLLRPRDLYLFGFDMGRTADGKVYWHDPYPWAKPTGGTGNARYAEWAAEFNEIALAFASISTKVINVSLTSKISCWRKVSAKDIGMGIGQ